LLKSEEYRRYLQRPELLRQELAAEDPSLRRQIVIDEVQKVPALLDAYVADYLKGLRHLAWDHPRVGRRVVVCLEPKARRTDDGIEILPAATFIRRLWAGELF
jgi:hypothetical protein